MRRILTCGVWLLLATQVSGAESQPAGARVTRNDGGTHTDVRLPGMLLSVATPRTPDGTAELYMLVSLPQQAVGDSTRASDSAGEPQAGSEAQAEAGPEIDGPESICAGPGLPRRVELWRLTRNPRNDEASLELLRADLPVDATAIDAADLNGDGIDELLIARPGQLFGLRNPAEPSLPWEALVEDPALEFAGLDRRVALQDDGGGTWLLVQDVGAARIYRAGAGDAEANSLHPFERVGEAKLQTHVGQFANSILASSPELLPAGVPQFATAPLVLADRIRVDRVEASGSTVECWGKLPAREQPLERFVRVLDGEPVAVLTTMESGKLNLFGEKRIRVFPLRPDRSRTGHSPLLAAETRINVWQSTTPYFVDIDGDGGTDLVLAYWKGLKDDRVVLEAYPRNVAGSFSMQPRSTAFDVKQGQRDWLHYGDDLNGDGIPDLVLRGDGKLQLYPGRRSLKEIVRRKSVRTMPLGPKACDDEDETVTSVSIGGGPQGGNASFEAEGGSVPVRIVDLNGDGIGEALMLSGSDCGTGRLQLFEFSADSGR